MKLQKFIKDENIENTGSTLMYWNEEGGSISDRIGNQAYTWKEEKQYGSLMIHTSLEDGYIEEIEAENFIYKIEGQDSQGKIVYSNVVAVTVGNEQTNTTIVENIPAGMNVIVQMLYSSRGYTVIGEDTQEAYIWSQAGVNMTAEVSFSGRKNTTYANIKAMYNSQLNLNNNMNGDNPLKIRAKIDDSKVNIVLENHMGKEYFVRFRVFAPDFVNRHYQEDDLWSYNLNNNDYV